MNQAGQVPAAGMSGLSPEQVMSRAAIPRRVCLMTETFYPVIGGGETQALGLSEDLVRAGHSVIVLTRRSEAAQRRAEMMSGFEVRRLGPSGTGQLKKWAMLPGAVSFLVARRRDYDVILVSGFRVLGIAACLAAGLLRKKCVLKADNSGEMSGEYFSHGIGHLGLGWARRPIGRLVTLRNALLKRCDRFVSLSNDMRAELLAHGVAGSRIVTIPNGYDPGRFRPVASLEERRRLRERLGLPPNDRLVIFTGRLLRSKGVPLLIDVWREMSSRLSDASLLIVGSGGNLMGSCEQEIRDLVDSGRPGLRIILTGAVRNVEDYLRASDVFVFPTENEAFGISLVEAMACGLPCLATAVGGINDVIQDGVNGLLIEPRNASELADGLWRLLSDPDQAETLGRRGALDASARYARQAVARSYVKLFDNLLDEASDAK